MRYPARNWRSAVTATENETNAIRPVRIGWPTAIFAIVATYMVVDIVPDLLDPTEQGIELAYEAAIMALSLLGLGLLLRDWGRQIRRATALERSLHASQAEARDWSAEAEKWRAEARGLVQGLGEAIDQQFARWDLTSAEREVALLQLKGLSHKEIADARGTSEQTIRQQAVSVYRKSGVGGRIELAAFFLEDLLLPIERKTESTSVIDAAAR